MSLLVNFKLLQIREMLKEDLTQDFVENDVNSGNVAA
jgi:hypothetical protein